MKTDAGNFTRLVFAHVPARWWNESQLLETQKGVWDGEMPYMPVRIREDVNFCSRRLAFFYGRLSQYYSIPGKPLLAVQY